ncbi:PREDICTED: separin [Dinoponera quadriceps]|uniref:separase n=1 Tax=Dinoponera quadriceps TaxID=609295 RepID=A0A6P3XCP5_DINQU|nr:PREDICTED: separin [Dinoponera quadriceps]
MARVTDKIMRILHKCHLNEDDYEDKFQDSKESNEEIRSHAEKLLTSTPNNYVGCIEYVSLNKMLATCNLKIGDEFTAIHHLIESHAVVLRQQILHRYQKTQMRESLLNEPQTYGLKPTYVKFDTNSTNSTLKSKLSELPKEWYMLQVTVQYESSNILKHTRHISSLMHALHITILPTGPSEIEPLCITLPKPAMQVSYDICTEIQNILASNKTKLEATYTNNEYYWTMRKEQDNEMKMAIDGLESTWLREWRVLFMADPIMDLEIVNEIHDMIDKLILDSRFSNNISKRCKWLLKKVSTGACFLTCEEIARAIKFLLPKHEKLANNIILSIYGMLSRTEKLKDAKRKTLVLIIDEHIDYIAFEAMEIIKNHPITRFPSLHIAYALFKEHENTIVDGCKIIQAKEDMGICIVNPSGNLHKMEKRLKLFINFWLPQWKSYYTEPNEEMFEDALVNHDVLMYNGHGSGIQYLPGEDIEKTKVRSTVLLFGCNSMKLLVIGGKYPPYGVANQYLIACSPCLLGTLWEVTDVDIDKMTANFISSWIPSTSKKSWAEVDVNSWTYGSMKFTKNAETNKTEMESEMLRAVAKSKKACSQYMTAAAIIVRGLPTKIV